MRDHDAWTAWIETHRRTPFRIGQHDCVTFAAGAIHALTGRHPLQGMARWKTERGALRALARAGGMEAAVSSRLREVPPALAHRGDIAMVEGQNGPLLCVIDGFNLIGPGPEGIQSIERAAMVKAWSADE